jgi:CRP-like cAMP-binding protein
MTAEHPDLLTGLPPEDVTAILALGAPIVLSAGDVLFELGGDAECLYVIRRGRIALTLPMQVGGRDEDIVFEEHVPGQTLGWSALVPPHRFTLKAAAPLTTEVLAIRRSDLLAYFAAHPNVGYIVGLNIAAIIGQRLQVLQAMWLREIQRVVRHVDA